MTRTIESNPVSRNLQKPSRKRAIEAMCSHCMGATSALQGNGFKDHLEAGFRTLIRDCTARGCPLYTWRPYQGKQQYKKDESPRV